jgi:hypothetical protein
MSDGFVHPAITFPAAVVAITIDMAHALAS